MTNDILVNIGEELYTKQGLDGLTMTVGVYNDATDSLSDTSDISGITTEPSNSNYSTASVSFSASSISGNWGVDNDAQFSFDFSDQSASETVDTFYIAYTFTSTEAGDSTANEHLIANPAMTQSRDIGSIDTLVVNAGNLSVTVN